MIINKTYALRFIKLPPATIVLGKAFEIAFSLTDDLGLELPGFPDLQICLFLQNTDAPDASYQYIVKAAVSGAPSIPISSSRSLIHKHTVTIVRNKNTGVAHRPLRNAFLGMRLESQASEVTDLSQPLEAEDELLLRYTGEHCTLHMPDDDVHALVLSTRAGPICLYENAKTITSSVEKVTKTEVHVSREPEIRIIERPMDRIIGDHLWHSSLILASAIANKAVQIPCVDAIVEIGAGCGLVSLEIAKSLPDSSTTILATDLAEVVETTLHECLTFNDHRNRIQPCVLEWGNDEHISSLLARLTGVKTVWLVAADVLYNTDSHQVFLDTIQRLSAAFERCQVTIAYRPRAYGDNHFFDLSKRVADMPYKQIWTGADVQIWQHAR